MAALALQRVSVWLDALAPGQAAFAHALDWAGRLGLPLRAIAARDQGPADRLGGEAVVECDTLDGDAAPLVRACAATCRRPGVPLDALTWRGRPEAAVRTLLGPAELCVLGDGLPTRLKGLLLRESLQRPLTPALICPAPWAPVSRLLVLLRHADPVGGFLAAAAEVCRRFDARPVVLTVARTDSEARRRQAAAEAVLAAQGLAADFDAAVGGDARTAVAWAARWRRCSHVVVAKRQAAGWWRPLRGGRVEDLLGLSDRLTLLALPDGLGASAAANPTPDLVR